MKKLMYLLTMLLSIAFLTAFTSNSSEDLTKDITEVTPELLIIDNFIIIDDGWENCLTICDGTCNTQCWD